MKDLFETPELIPPRVVTLLYKVYKEYPLSYEDCNNLINQLHKLGYTCQYGLDAEPYGLTKQL